MKHSIIERQMPQIVKRMKTCTLAFLLGTCSFSVANASLPEVQAVQQSSTEIRGRVVDSQNEPLIGVNILVKGTNIGAISDIDGYYTVQANQGSTLEFSYIGYITQEVQVTNQRTRRF
ncbi:carboxypeptidase-like regulatory domain-containing protein [Bacteroides sp. 519]|uniref:carboxypeptidase-like regulatory domain-containing protein n=1 Tax=Bacteroides sp. 519 TaxID=2302937 RepID=UPI0019402FFC|nr:carboxypeptidase-like regulatory domain-containing protein [Bacteroides sp. 519]